MALSINRPSSAQLIEVQGIQNVKNEIEILKIQLYRKVPPSFLRYSLSSQGNNRDRHVSSLLQTLFIQAAFFREQLERVQAVEERRVEFVISLQSQSWLHESPSD